MKKLYVIRLTLEERERLHDLVHKGRVAAYKRRNALGIPVQWRFTTEDARIKLHGLYPKLSDWWSTR